MTVSTGSRALRGGILAIQEGSTAITRGKFTGGRRDPVDLSNSDVFARIGLVASTVVQITGSCLSVTPVCGTVPGIRFGVALIAFVIA